ncbi:MAG: gluconate 5-dehydrogenase [Sulfobacillus benefaciens]|uniref:Gluconate 5-dehydrogenase n=1 Tax=Sulfobacillus benefaciens TaxID=453960 RepID=A0A2T2XI06_9FIRM|nr:MAG: gluconate 5-dehydrogenase [Sulfobacillus benefaciens]
MSIPQLFDLRGKIAVITGGGRGLGKQIAEGFAAAGATVVLGARHVDACETTLEELKIAYGANGDAWTLDVTQPSSVQETVRGILARWGQIDVLVNNSGSSWGASVEDMPLERWEQVWRTNVSGTFLMCQTVGPHMIQRHQGNIINMSSVAALKCMDPRVMDAIGYSVSKDAINTFTKELAVRWGPKGIRVNALAPGFFPSRMTAHLFNDASSRQFLENQTPLRRLGSDYDLVGAALLLASSAGSYVTGQVLAVDGGMSV